ncbi:helix-turn-helix transcriptional regulator [Nonomuraea sp. NPDC050404]|uniref:helix-turn-helix transcriptional regulator n=1 Tax=Nonomuraea sp. NPDC050404 TaxID=3155783 RepID=UPI003402CCFF
MDLSAQDYERMLDLAIELLDSAAPELEWPRLAAELNESLHGALCLFLDDVRYFERDGHVEAWSPQSAGELPLDTILRENMGDHPLAIHYATHEEDRAPLAVADVAGRAEWRRTPTYLTMREVLGVDQNIALPLAAPPGVIRAFLVCRPPGEEVSERDHAFAARVQPLLIAAEKHLRYLSRWRESFTAPARDPGRLAGWLGVTPRELCVLSLLAEGLTASAIGRRLGISPRTVSKHQENLYRKLEATNRVTAIRHAQWLGLVPETKPQGPTPER